MELGIYISTEMTPDPRTGKTVSAHQRIRDHLEEIELAEQAGLDIIVLILQFHLPPWCWGPQQREQRQSLIKRRLLY